MKLLYLLLASCLIGNIFAMDNYQFCVSKKELEGLKIFSELKGLNFRQVMIQNTTFKDRRAFLTALQSVGVTNQDELIIDIRLLENVIGKEQYDYGMQVGNAEATIVSGIAGYRTGYDRGFAEAKKRYFWQGFGTGAVVAGLIGLGLYYKKITDIFRR